MEIRPIHTEEDYRRALEAINEIFDSKPGSPEGEALEILATLVEDYESKHYSIPLPDPIEAIEYHMERLGLTRKNLEKFIGGPSRVSEILNRKRPLNLRMIRNLHKGLGISLDVLFQEYDVEVPELDFSSDFLSVLHGVFNFEFSTAGSGDKIYPKLQRKSRALLEIIKFDKTNLESSDISVPNRFSITTAYNATESERIAQ